MTTKTLTLTPEGTFDYPFDNSYGGNIFAYRLPNGSKLKTISASVSTRHRSVDTIDGYVVTALSLCIAKRKRPNSWDLYRDYTILRGLNQTQDEQDMYPQGTVTMQTSINQSDINYQIDDAQSSDAPIPGIYLLLTVGCATNLACYQYIQSQPAVTITIEIPDLEIFPEKSSYILSENYFETRFKVENRNNTKVTFTFRANNVKLAEFKPYESEDAGEYDVVVEDNYYVGEEELVVEDGGGEELVVEDGGGEEGDITKWYVNNEVFTWFKTLSALSSITLTVEAVDDTIFKRTARCTITINGGDVIKPKFSAAWLTNNPDSRMPSVYDEKFVAGYSTASVYAGVEETVSSISSVTVSYSGVSNAVMEKSYSYNRYEYTTKIITGETTFTIRATDNQGRTSTISLVISSDMIVRLQNLSIDSISPGSGATSIFAGDTIIASISNSIGECTYALFLSGVPIVDETDFEGVSFETAPIQESWFNDVNSITINLVVRDGLDREASRTFTARLPTFQITSITSPVLVGEEVTITFSGRAGKSVDITLSCNNWSSSYSSSGDEKEITCSESWFNSAGVSTASMQIKVEAVSGTRKDSKSFLLKFPDLQVTANQSSAYVGDVISYSFSGRSGQSIYLDYKYGQQTLRTEGPYSTESEQLSAPQLFDLANITNSKVMNVNVSIRDSRGRTSPAVGIVLQASTSMRPTLGNAAMQLVQPQTVDSSLSGIAIAGISKLTLSGEYSLPTKADVASITVYGNNLTSTATVNKLAKTYTFTTPNPLTTEDLTFRVEIIDSRGMSAEKTVSLSQNPIPYTAPTISMTYRRCNDDGTRNDSGDHCIFTVDYRIDPIYFRNENHNTAELTISAGLYSHQIIIPTLEDETPIYESSFEDIFAADIEQSYVITVLIDDLVLSYANTYRLSTAGVIMDFRRGGKGIGLGKVAEYDNLVEVNPDWEFRAKVKVNGSLVDLGTILSDIQRRLN